MKYTKEEMKAMYEYDRMIEGIFYKLFFENLSEVVNMVL